MRLSRVALNTPISGGGLIHRIDFMLVASPGDSSLLLIGHTSTCGCRLKMVLNIEDVAGSRRLRPSWEARQLCQHLHRKCPRALATTSDSRRVGGSSCMSGASKRHVRGQQEACQGPARSAWPGCRLGGRLGSCACAGGWKSGY